MKMKKLSDLFEITYGNKLDLNKMKLTSFKMGGINFVGRSSQNHGVTAIVEKVQGVESYPEGSITVALGGTKLLSSFIQQRPFYTAQNVAILKPIASMNNAEKMYVCLCIAHNRFRYSAFGREANRTLKNIEIPSKFPKWIYSYSPDKMENYSKPFLDKPLSSLNIDSISWAPFTYEELFRIERGRGPRVKELTKYGSTPFITSTDSNNGLSGYTEVVPCHKGNVISVNRNGSVGEAYYQADPFCSTEDVHVFNPKFDLNRYTALFLITLIRKEKFRFNYGRKWGIDRMKKSIINLPVTKKGLPDWAFMEKYIKSLPYSSTI